MRGILFRNEVAAAFSGLVIVTLIVKLLLILSRLVKIALSAALP
jgi:hypothetical protein